MRKRNWLGALTALVVLVVAGLLIWYAVMHADQYDPTPSHKGTYPTDPTWVVSYNPDYSSADMY